MRIHPLGLIQDAKTRWSSEHDILARLLELREAICLELSTSDAGILYPTPVVSLTLTAVVIDVWVYESSQACCTDDQRSQWSKVHSTFIGDTIFTWYKSCPKILCGAG